MVALTNSQLFVQPSSQSQAPGDECLLASCIYFDLSQVSISKHPLHWLIVIDSRFLKMSEVKKKESFTLFAQVLAEGQGIGDYEDIWYVGNASDHMTPKREWFTTFEVPEGDWSVGEPDGGQHWVRGRGKIKIQRKVGLQWEDGVLENVVYAPALRRNLFSLGQAVQPGNYASPRETVERDRCTVRNSEGVEIWTGSEHEGLFKLNARVMPPELSC